MLHGWLIQSHYKIIHYLTCKGTYKFTTRFQTALYTLELFTSDLCFRDEIRVTLRNKQRISDWISNTQEFPVGRIEQVYVPTMLHL